MHFHSYLTMYVSSRIIEQKSATIDLSFFPCFFSRLPSQPHNSHRKKTTFLPSTHHFVGLHLEDDVSHEESRLNPPPPTSEPYHPIILADST